jgi:tripartite-type tricarboxylate transporter receptor subunit TctC
MRRFLAALTFVVVVPQGANTLAQDWPQRPVRIIAPFGVGGTADIVSRFVADHLSTTFKQPFIVENRTGAGGAIGSQAIAKAEPDGYTLGVTNLTTMSLVPVIAPKTPYHPIKDFTHIAYIAGAPVMLAVHPSAKVRTVAELVEYSRTLGKPLTFASAGVGSDGHVMGEAIAAALKISVSHVPYRSTVQGLTDAAGGHVVFSTLTSASTSTFIRAGTLLPLAVTSPQRLSDYPDVPTLRELGHPSLVSSTWYALSAPAGFPRPVAVRLHAELSTLLARPEVQKQLSRYGLLHEAMSMEAFNRFVANESARWKPMIEAANMVIKE